MKENINYKVRKKYINMSIINDCSYNRLRTIFINANYSLLKPEFIGDIDVPMIGHKDVASETKALLH